MLDKMLTPDILSTIDQQGIDALKLQVEQERLEISNSNKETKALTEELVIRFWF